MKQKKSGRSIALALWFVLLLSACQPVLALEPEAAASPSAPLKHTYAPVIAAGKKGNPHRTPTATGTPTPTATSTESAPPGPIPIASQTPTPTASRTATPTASPTSTAIGGADMPASNLFLDVNWYRSHLVQSADLWNGGLDGQSGLNTYRSNFDGLFRANLGRQWNTLSLSSSTAVAQSRAIYMNVEAYRVAGPTDGQRFLTAVNKGVDYLLAHFHDSQYGGYYWAVAPGGSVADSRKDGYGNVHPLMALSQAYAVTHNPQHLQAARDQLAVIKQHFLDPQYPGGVRPGFDRSFSQIQGINNVDVFTHLFEALMAYYDVVDGTEKTDVGQMIQTSGNFLVNQLYNNQAGFTDRGYVAYYYDSQWRPTQQPYTPQTQWSGARQASTGHNVELAYLLSRAVERGFSQTWLETARKLVKFSEVYALDPKYHAMWYYITDYDGTPLPGNPDNEWWYWWPQAETARAFVHFAVVRGWDTSTQFKAVEDFFHRYQTDQTYRGLYQRLHLDASGQPVPDLLDKGTVWKTNYHYSMFFVEVLRLAAQYPAQVAALNPK